MVYACPMLGFGYAGGGYLGMILGTLLWIAIIIGIVWLAIRLINKENNKEKEGHTSSPLEILKERYARGEINKPEYEKMKRELK
ncbi:MAG: SHOCT domain-containing protein [Nanoarchaeota archaeon]